MSAFNPTISYPNPLDLPIYGGGTQDSTEKLQILKITRDSLASALEQGALKESEFQNTFQEIQKLNTQIIKLENPVLPNTHIASPVKQSSSTPTVKKTLEISQWEGGPYSQRKVVKGEMQVLDTVGEGSCAFHALLGKYNSKLGKFECKDHKEVRKEFAQHLEKGFEKGNIPKSIESDMQSWCRDPGYANIPTEVKNAPELKGQWDLLKQLINLKMGDSVLFRNTVNDMMKSKVFQNNYLNHIIEPKSSMSIGELQAAADWKKIPVRINEDHRSMGVLRPDHAKVDNEIEIIISDHHFSRANFIPAK